jgi:hypothetical protein
MEILKNNFCIISILDLSMELAKQTHEKLTKGEAFLDKE